MSINGIEYGMRNADLYGKSEAEKQKSFQTEDTDMHKLLQEKMEEMREKLRIGETEPSYQIGGQSFTLREWDRFLMKFDLTQEQIRQQQREEIAKRLGKTGQDEAVAQNASKKMKVTNPYMQEKTVSSGMETLRKSYTSENYRIVPDHEAECFDIYNKKGEHLGAFSYADIKIRQDAGTGKQFLISEHGTMSYDALVLDEELKEDLTSIMRVDELKTETLQGFTVKTHSGTGIQYLLKDGEEGRGGKVLLQTEADREKYEALAETYFRKYPNLIKDKKASYIWADLEIKGLAQHTEKGILSMGFNGMSYHDNLDDKNNWSVLFSNNAYQLVYEWLQNNRGDMEEIQKFSIWQKVFEGCGGYQRIWSDEEEKQGYLNN